MGLHSGKHGVVNGISTVGQWSISETQAPARGIASNTKFGPVRKHGVRSWNGSFNAFGATPSVLPGESFSFLGYGAPANDVSGNGFRYSGGALVSGVTINWNWSNGEMINHTVNFDGNLELAKAVGAAIIDVSAIDMPEVCGTKIEIEVNGTGGFSELENLVSATLNITCALQSYANSSTHINGKCWTGQKAGPIDWSLAITQQNDGGDNAFDIGDELALRLYVNDTAYWLLKFGHVRDFSGITVDRQSGAIIQRTINIDMNAYYNNTYGTITLPDTSVWWPV